MQASASQKSASLGRGDQATRVRRLEKVIGHASHVLPAQGPITVFIHHNTLHAFEDLPFHEAVKKGAQVFGCHPYLSEDRYRDALARGRIRFSDLQDVLEEDLGTRAGEEIPCFGNRIGLWLGCSSTRCDRGRRRNWSGTSPRPTRYGGCVARCRRFPACAGARALARRHLPSHEAGMGDPRARNRVVFGIGAAANLPPGLRVPILHTDARRHRAPRATADEPARIATVPGRFLHRRSRGVVAPTLGSARSRCRDVRRGWLLRRCNLLQGGSRRSLHSALPRCDPARNLGHRGSPDRARRGAPPPGANAPGAGNGFAADSRR